MFRWAKCEAELLALIRAGKHRRPSNARANTAHKNTDDTQLDASS